MALEKSDSIALLFIFDRQDDICSSCVQNDKI